MNLNDQMGLGDNPNLKWNQPATTPPPSGKESVEHDPFIEKHLNIIMGKMLDAMIVTHIEKMWGGLEMASVQNFVENGKVNGSFNLRIKELAMTFAQGWHRVAAKAATPDSREEGKGETPVQFAEGEDDIAFDFHRANTPPAPVSDAVEGQVMPFIPGNKYGWAGHFYGACNPVEQHMGKGYIFNNCGKLHTYFENKDKELLENILTDKTKL